MNVRKMTYRQLEQEALECRIALRKTADLAEKRKLIAESHACMVEMDRRWNEAEGK